MAAKKDIVDKLGDLFDKSQTFNPLLNMLKENDKKNLFNTNVITAFHKTGFPVFDYYFGALINIHDELGRIIRQEPRLGQAAGTFNLIVGDTGSGKAQPLSTKIPTPDGYKLMGDLKVGDRVFGSDGNVYKITGVYPQGTKDVYEITFSDGRTARCCEDHLWNVITYSHGKDKVKTLKLKDIMKDYVSHSSYIDKHKYRIQTLSAPVQYDHHDVPVDPYVLGVFIGNGCLCEKVLSLSSPDYSIPSFIAKKYGFELHKYSDKNFTWTFKDNVLSNIKTDDFFCDIPEMINCKAGEKKIPDIYLYNDVETRISLLQGLMDTDGSISCADGRYSVSYSSCSKTLLEQIQVLIRSLGFNGNISEDKRSDKYKNGYCGSIIFQVPNYFKGDMFNISPKAIIANECAIISKKRKYGHIVIKDIKKVSREECQCIMVDSPDHLYITEDFIVTHNTTLAEQIAGYVMVQYKNSNTILFDCEQRTSVSRVETVTKLPSYFFHSSDGTPPRFMIKSGAVGLDVIQEMIVKLYVSKMKLKKELMISSGFKDEFGKDVIIFPPTFIIIDSITTVLNETFSPDSSKEAADAEKMRGNTEGARDAKTLKGFFKDILPLCKEANIIVYGINHLNQNMSMNAFLPVAKQQNFLKQSEVIPGGKTMLYYPHNIIKLVAKPSDDFTVESDGFAGHIVMVEPIKSSSNQSGNDSKGISFEMVFSFRDGFLPMRTNVWYARNYGIIEGTKARMKFKGDDSFTFSWKNLEKEIVEKPIWEDMKKYVYPHLDTHLPYLEPSDIKLDMRMFEY